MEEQEHIDRFNALAPKFIGLLGGRVIAADSSSATCTFEYNIGTDYCHSGNVVQGGFVTAMLDAAMTHAALFCR